jgi:predicted CXXCH cytochrome family protein
MNVLKVFISWIAGLSLTLFLISNVAYAASQDGATYVGSDNCQECHQRIYKTWKQTLHSQMVKDVKKNPNAIIGDFESKSDVRTFGKEGILYTIGNQWKQRYIKAQGDELYILPAQYNLETGRWKPYHPDDWDKRPWLKKCGNCHVTGLNYEKRSFVEPGVGCEACHGPGSKHIQAKNPLDVPRTITNPANLAVGLQVQVCGQCHTRGKDPSGVHGYPVGFKPGMSLLNKYNPIDPGSDKKHFWPNGHSKAHHQQYLDWQTSQHAKEGVNCVSCHTVHDTGAATRYQTRLPGDKLCLSCHTPTANPTRSHSLHDMNSCISCHMAKIVKSAESGDLHDHTFKVIQPKVSIKHGGVDKQANSCNYCHYHKDHDPAYLQKALDAVKKSPADTASTDG